MKHLSNIAIVLASATTLLASPEVNGSVPADISCQQAIACEVDTQFTQQTAESTGETDELILSSDMENQVECWALARQEAKCFRGGIEFIVNIIAEIIFS